MIKNAGTSAVSGVLGPVVSNAEVYISGSLSTFNNNNFGNVLRWNDDSHWYKALIEGPDFIIEKCDNGVFTTLASMPFTANPGVSYTVHFRAVGSTLFANVWASSGSEPSGWMLTATDDTFTSGYCGIRILLDTGTAWVTFFLAKSA
jgi:hypothetical protein